MRATIFIFLAISCTYLVQAQTVVNIPDQKFFQAMRNAVDLNNDGQIQIEEAESIDSLTVANADISNLKGIEAFVNLEYLDCSGNELTSLTVTSNTKLKVLICGFNQIKTLKIDSNLELTYLDCVINPLAKIDVSKNTKLEELHCFYNDLTVLDVSFNTLLKTLRCDNNSLSSIDLSKNIALKDLSCPYNNITMLDVTQNKNLQSLDCYSNKITNIDLTQNTALIVLNIYSNELKSLYVSKNTSLTSLVCTSNPDLKVICVWEVDSVDKKAQFQKDPTAVWADTCTLITSVREEMNTELYKLYPNPVEETLYMNTQVKSILLYDVLGVEVLRTSVDNGNVDLSMLRTGIYTAKLSYANGQSSCQKLIKK